MDQVPKIDLPTAPSRGNRRRLEEVWLERLERSGFRGSDLEVPATPPSPLVSAVRQFNEGRYWDCHETLEDLWRETPYPLRFVYHAVIKAAVGFHHLSRHNRNGARLKLSDAARLLSLFQPDDSGDQDRRAEGRGSRAAWPARRSESPSPGLGSMPCRGR